MSGLLGTQGGGVEFRILGSLEVVGSAPVDLTGQRERVLLARLLVSANQVVSSERLIDDVWEDAPPDNARRALPVYISRLRKTLRGAGLDHVVSTCAPGYVIRLEPGDFDAALFEALVASGREQAAAGNPQEASLTLGEALALWRGPALADVADLSFARGEAARLEEARLSALEDRIDADLACGRHGGLMAELAALVAAHPLRERLWGQHMLALYRAGRQADALRAYQELRGILVEELGVEPSAAVARLETAILRHDEELDWKPSPGISPSATPAPGRAKAPLPAGASDSPAPATVVTFLFTDVVGSTEMLGRLGDDAAEQLRLRQVNVLRAAVAAEGGSEVKNLGDGLMVAFASPLAALRCAVAIQQGIDRDNREAGTQVQIRVGLHAGEPLRYEDDYFGTPVVVAKRLCDRAQGGQILASALLRGLVGNRGGLAFRDQGHLVLKGLDEPVPTFEVCWTPESDETTARREGRTASLGDAAEPPAPLSVPLPHFLTDVGRIFVGREAEVARLEQLWKEAAAEQRRVALLAGEPGVGKTRLAAEVSRRAHGEGAVVLAGRCEEDLGVPYQPFVEALRHFADHTPSSRLRQCLGRYGGELARLVPELVERAPGLPAPLRSDPETERYRLFDAVATWLAAASAEAPVLVVLDDLQWAAKPTLLLLRHVVHSAEPMRLLVLGTYRDSELAHDHPLVELIADLHRQAGMQRLVLSGLDDTAVAAFVEQASGAALDEEGVALAHAIYAETEGNPFFVREVLRHLRETGAVEERQGVWVASRPVEELGIPEGVRDVVGRRLSHLSKDTNRMLRVAAVVGAEFDLGLLQAADVVDEEDLVGALEEATAARLVVEVAGAVPRYRFAHALVRDTLYAGLSAARRTTLHRRVAEAIEAVHGAGLDDHLPALAHHWARAAAPAPELDKAVDYTVRAGDRALAQLAHDEAAAYYHQALELTETGGGDEAGQLEVLIRLGEAQRRAGDPGHRRTLLDAAALARRLGDTDGLVRAALANGRAIAYSRLGELDPERIAVLEAALEDVAETDLEVRARLMANLAVELVFAADRHRRVALSDEALAAARTSGDDAVLAHVLMARYYTILSPNTLPERLTNTGELVAVTQRLGDPFIAAMARFFRVRTAMETSDLEEADRCLAALEAHAADLRQPFVQWVAQFTRTGRELLAGRYDVADRVASAALKTGQAAGQHEAVLVYTLERLQTQIERDKLADAHQTLADAIALGFRLPLLDSLQAMLACELQQEDEARGLLSTLAAENFRAVPVNNLWLGTIANCAVVAARLSNPDTSDGLYGILAPYAQQLPVALLVPSGCVAYHLGMLASVLGRGKTAEEHFVHAAEIHTSIGAPVWLARTHLEWARMLLTCPHVRDPDRARQLLGQAVSTARKLGLGNVEQRATALLRECP